MRCPFCGHREDKVVDSRITKAGEAIRRRRQCLSCKQRFTTYERLEEVFPRIVKRDGSREDYDRSKIVHGLNLACRKRAISADELDEVVSNLERKMLELGEREVSSDWLGSELTDQLRDLDPVAYIRFASVYHNFDDIQAFLTELQKLNISQDEQA